MPAQRVRFVYRDEEHHDRPVEVGPEGFHQLREDPACSVELQDSESEEIYRRWLGEEPEAEERSDPEPAGGLHLTGGDGGWYTIRDGDGGEVEKVRGEENARERMEEIE